MAAASAAVVARSLAEEREGRRERPQTFAAAAAAGATLQIPEPSAAENGGLFTSVDLIDCFSRE